MNRRTSMLAFVCIAAATGSVISMISAARSEPLPGIVKAREIVLVDPRGRARIVLGVNQQTGAASINVMDAVSGNPRIVIGTGDDQSSRIELHDADGHRRADLTQSGSTVRLSLPDADFKGGVVLGAASDGKVMLVFNDGTPVTRVALGLNTDKEGNVAVYDSKGAATWTAVAAPHP